MTIVNRITAISIKIVSKTREKVEYERDGRLYQEDYCYFIPEYIIIHKFSTYFTIRSCFLMNINRDYESLRTKFCSVCVLLIVTPSKLFALVVDYSALLGTTIIEIAVILFTMVIHVETLARFRCIHGLDVYLLYIVQYNRTHYLC